MDTDNNKHPGCIIFSVFSVTFIHWMRENHFHNGQLRFSALKLYLEHCLNAYWKVGEAHTNDLTKVLPYIFA